MTCRRVSKVAAIREVRPLRPADPESNGGRYFRRLDFRRFLESGLRSSREGVSAGSFPEQRLVIEPTTFGTLPYSAGQNRIQIQADPCSTILQTSTLFVCIILGDPGTDSWGGEKSKRARKKKFGRSFFLARLDFSPPPLSAPGSPRMPLYKPHTAALQNCYYSRTDTIIKEPNP